MFHADNLSKAKALLHFSHLPVGWCGTMLLIIPELMDAMVTVTWRREAVVSVTVGIRLLWLTFRDIFSTAVLTSTLHDEMQGSYL